MRQTGASPRHLCLLVPLPALLGAAGKLQCGATSSLGPAFPFFPQWNLWKMIFFPGIPAELLLKAGAAAASPGPPFVFGGTGLPGIGFHSLSGVGGSVAATPLLALGCARPQIRFLFASWKIPGDIN